jgi:multiple sugar transport system substrate-binding protein
MSGRWKRGALLVALLAVSGVVAASLAQAKNDRVGGSSKANETVLTIMGFGTGDDVAETRAALATKVVGGDVERPSGSFNDQQFLAAVASKNVPDLVYLDRQKVGTYAAKGAFVPLTSCVSKEKINTKQYRIPALQEVTYKGRLYGIPEFYDVRTVLVNNDVLDLTKTKISSLNTKNWPALLAAAKKMYDSSGGKVTRIGFDPKIPEFFPLWAKANGVDILSKDGLKPNLNNPKAIAALTYTVSLINAQGGWDKFKSFRDTWDFFGKNNQVAENQVGAWPMEQWYYNVLASNSPNVHITALQFRNKAGQPLNYETGSAWAIPKGAQHQDAACKWMKTMTSTATWLAAAKNRAQLRKSRNQPYTGLSTGNAVADNLIYEQTYTPINRFFDQAVKKVLEVQRFSFGVPASPASAEFKQAWNDAINRVLAGQQSPKDAMNQAQKEAESAIKKATS